MKKVQIPLYNDPPEGFKQLEELEKIVLARINILDQFENKEKDSYKIILSKEDYDKSPITLDKNPENDVISHFLLCVANCKNEQTRITFAEQESKLFIARINFYNNPIEDILRTMNIPLETEHNIEVDLLNKIRFNSKDPDYGNVKIYKIPFEYGLNLLYTMNFFLKNGYIYITNSELEKLAETVFKENLLKKISVIHRNIDKILSDSRIEYLIKEVESKREVKTILNINKISNENKISMKEIEEIYDKAFPLCMQLIHKHVNINSHLMHHGRLQYGLFLKGVGLSLEDSIIFFKNKYSRVTNEDKFEKEYSYNIRHYYGKEGKRADYHPWNCTKVQNLPTPGAKESHGCPFKEFSEDKMRKILYDSKLKDTDVIGILEKKRNNEYSVACIRYFEAKHNVIPEKVGIHPNFYFESYMKYVRQSKNFKSKTYVNSNKNTDVNVQKMEEFF